METFDNLFEAFSAELRKKSEAFQVDVRQMAEKVEAAANEAKAKALEVYNAAQDAAEGNAAAIDTARDLFDEACETATMAAEAAHGVADAYIGAINDLQFQPQVEAEDEKIQTELA